MEDNTAGLRDGDVIVLNCVCISFRYYMYVYVGICKPAVGISRI